MVKIRINNIFLMDQIILFLLPATILKPKQIVGIKHLVNSSQFIIPLALGYFYFILYRLKRPFIFFKIIKAIDFSFFIK